MAASFLTAKCVKTGSDAVKELKCRAELGTACTASNSRAKNFMVTPCINNAEPFHYQLMHIMLKNTELLTLRLLYIWSS